MAFSQRVGLEGRSKVMRLSYGPWEIEWYLGRWVTSAGPVYAESKSLYTLVGRLDATFYEVVVHFE